MQSTDKLAAISSSGRIVVKADCWGDGHVFHLHPRDIAGSTAEEIEASMRREILDQLAEAGDIEINPGAVSTMLRLKRQGAAQR